ncbi:hypothetical protein [Streptomyces ochraceiscleroticus]|uniref:Aromatic ring-opening dioxygenase LigA n=1 Tax=Streptomyces ochraceiscleroticus TaxID=47761 RepID=A0ABW1MCW2_9ACTN|nr:hypothetical protein [Streptomyces ochraceiscleroticus]
MKFTHRPVLGATAIALCCLAIIAGVLYATGVYDRWRDDMSLDDACAGTVARGDLASALGSKEVRASGAGDEGEGALAACQVHDRTSEESRLVLDIRWAGDPGRDFRLAPHPSSHTGQGAVAPLEHGWPGVASQGPNAYQVSLVMECRNRKNDALFVNGNLLRGEHSAGAGARAAFARVTTETAARAAKRFGCKAASGTRITHIADPLSDEQRRVSHAKGTCAALRPYSKEAEAAGLDAVRETAATRNAPVEDCFVGTADDPGTPSYRALALFGPYPRMVRDAGDTTAFGNVGKSGKNHTAWATAKCPGSSDRALFTLGQIASANTSAGKRHYLPAQTEVDVLTAFAKDSADRHGCTDVRLP